jgi:hypothetical protein
VVTAGGCCGGGTLQKLVGALSSTVWSCGCASALPKPGRASSPLLPMAYVKVSVPLGLSSGAFTWELTCSRAVGGGGRCSGMVIWVWVLLNLIGIGMGIIFYLCVLSVSDLNRDGKITGIFFHPRVTRRVSDTLLPL